MDRFEKYLCNKHKFISDMISVISKSNNPKLESEVEILDAQLEILDDIIHHFKVFVKGAEDG